METLGLTSVSEVRNYIKQFHFEPGFGINPWEELTFSDTDLIRLSPQDFSIKLKSDNNGFYSTNADIWARTWITNPLALRRITMFQSLPNIQPDNTGVQFRIYDGTNDYYWNGAAWVVAGASDWNTEEELNANLSSFNVLPNRQFAVTMNLFTTDREATPSIYEIKLLTEMNIDYVEDIVLRSLLPSLESEVRPVTNLGHILPFTTDVSTIDLNDYETNTSYNIIDVVGVYDFTDDDELLYNLLDSYNPSTKIVSLSSDLPATHRPLILARYQPEVVYIQHQDYYEVAKLPTLLIQGLEIPTEAFYNLVAQEGIVDRATGDAKIIYEPTRATFEFRIHGLTASVVDEMRLITKLNEYFNNNLFLRSVGLDELYRMRVVREFRDMSNANKADERAYWTRFNIFDVRMPLRSEDAQAVMQVNLTFSEPKPPHEDPIKGGSEVVPTTHREDGPIQWNETISVT